MSLHNSRFPLSISYGSSGGPTFNTAVHVKDQGGASAVRRWNAPLYRFNVSPGIKTRADMMALLRFFLARGGPANLFRYFDHRDHTTNADGRTAPTFTDVVIGVGDGSTTEFQLKKVYTEGGETTTRPITLPIHNETLGAPVSTTYNVLVGVNGVQQLSGWTVNTQTGKITFTTAPTAGHNVTAGCAFDVQVRFDKELDDSFLPAHTDYDVEELDEITLTEDRLDAIFYDEVNFGGAKHLGSLGLNAVYQLSANDGRVITFVATSTGVKIKLPAVAAIPTGGPHFFVCNLGGSASAALTDTTGGVTYATLAADTLYEVVLGLDSLGAKVWLVR